MAISPRPSRVCRRWSRSRRSDPQPQRWYQLFKEMPKDPWHTNYIYISPAAKTRAVTISIPPGRIAKPDTPDDDPGGS